MQRGRSRLRLRHARGERRVEDDGLDLRVVEEVEHLLGLVALTGTARSFSTAKTLSRYSMPL
jgi:hypothetical protein